MCLMSIRLIHSFVTLNFKASVAQKKKTQYVDVTAHTEDRMSNNFHSIVHVPHKKNRTQSGKIIRAPNNT